MEPKDAWQVWANANRPDPPSITLQALLPDKIATSSLYIDALSETAYDWLVVVDGAEKMTTSGRHLQGSLNLVDGMHSISINARAAVFPEEEYLKPFGPVYSVSEAEFEVLVDTQPPQFTSVTSSASVDGKSMLVSGTLTDLTSGVCCVKINGYENTNLNVVTIDGSGSFSLSIPVESIGIATSMTITGFDRLNNQAVASVEVTLPPNRWERIDSNGQWVDINTTPGFDPFNMDVVGFLQVIRGYDGDYWVQYVNGIAAAPRSEPVVWGRIKIGLYVIGALLVLVLLGYLVNIGTLIPRTLAKNMQASQARSSTALAKYAPGAQGSQLSTRKNKTRDQLVDRLLLEGLKQFMQSHPDIRDVILLFLKNDFRMDDKLRRAIEHESQHAQPRLENKE